MKVILIFILLIISDINPLYSQSELNVLRTEDKIRIAEAVRIFNEYGNSVWKEWNNAPFALLLITNENEYLMYHSNPSDDFTDTGFDSITGSNIYIRPRQFSNNFLATFPAITGVSTIVIGLPENTSRQGLDWILTLLHEHFHQFQTTQSDYYSAVESLDLAGDDMSGMWMLNYKFPYDNKLISEQYKILTLSAKKTYLSINDTDFEINLKNYLSERDKFKLLLDIKDYDYFSFQIWQEGIARYTETEIAEFLKDNYKPSNEYLQLNDFISFDSFYVKIINKLLDKADKQELNENQRNCFYTLGALEGMILDKINPGWKDLYFKDKFYIEKFYNVYN